MTKGFSLLIVLIVVVTLGGISWIALNKPFSGYKPLQSIQPIPTPIPTPTPVPTGSLSGKVTGGYYAKTIKEVGVYLNQENRGVTDSNGSFNLANISVGKYTLTFQHPEYTFTGFEIEITEGKNKLERPVLGILTNPKPTNLMGTCFIDNNRNSSKDGGDSSLDAMASLYYWEKNTWTYQKYFKCDTSGTFNATIAQIGKYQLRPGAYTFYAEPETKNLVVDGYGGTKTFFFAYLPLKVQSGWTIYVFNDKNENSNRDDGEENIHYQYVKITNLSGSITDPLGNTYNDAVSTSGSSFNQFNPGNYRFELIPETTSWSTSHKITKGEASITFTQTTGHQTIYLGAHKLN